MITFNNIPTRSGSAWETWQIAGLSFKRNNPIATDFDIAKAATFYAENSGFFKVHVYRAFMQGVEK